MVLGFLEGLKAWIVANPIGASVTLLCFGIVLFYLIRERTRIRKFIQEVRVELAKCSWPWDPQQTGLRRYKELVDSTILVMVSMFLLGFYTGIFDFLLGKATTFLTSISV